jgi:GT2 family glycosyltransferase
MQHTNKPFASVIIITRNRPKILANCLDHLGRQTYTDFEIVVVDSSDNYETKELLFSWPSVCYLSIWDGRNNMPAARNLGLSSAQGDVVAFIDDDCMVFPDWLENIISGYSIDEKIGGVGGSIIDERFTNLQHNVVGTVFDDGTVIQNFLKENHKNLMVEWLGGGNMSFRRSILNNLGGFDQNYTGNNSYEDVDISARVRKAGYKLLFVPTAVVDHIFATRDLGVVSRDYENPQVRYHHIHNRAYFVKKNIGLNKVYIKYVFNTLFGLTTSTLKKPNQVAWKLLGATILGFISGAWDSFIKK